MNTKYELMAPAGNFPMLATAVKAGADAVYFGLNDFSMRASSKNFSISDLNEINEVCESGKREVKKYLTLNTIIYDAEIDTLRDILSNVAGKVDAVICWDHAVMMLCKEYNIPFFVSTQASISNVFSAEFYKQLGAQRAVLARELSLDQIAPISEVIEVECFIHGAMCVAISGRCFMSQFTSEKSANRGECHQNCRRSYTITDSSGNQLELENSRVMSAKDLCTLHLIPKMKEAGVTSYKIEGRGRDPRYVETVTKAYRKALDEDLSDSEIKEMIIDLKKVFNRSFSTGFYLGEPSAEDFSNAENNEATEIKTYIGKIVNYYSNPKVASIQLVADLKIGDEIVIVGNKTGLERTKVSSMQKDHSNVSAAVKGDEVGIQIENVRRNDEVYLISQK